MLFDTTSTGADELVRALTEAGVAAVFGAHENQTRHPLQTAVRAAQHITYFGTNHEASASSMAQGYARVTGEPGVFLSTCRRGALQAAGSLAAADTNSTPIVALIAESGREPAGARIGRADRSRLLHDLTKDSRLTLEPSRIYGDTQWALRSAATARPGPVALELPLEVLGSGARNDRFSFETQPLQVVPPPELIDRLAELLASARRPVLFLGGGTQWGDAGAHALALARQLARGFEVAVRVHTPPVRPRRWVASSRASHHDGTDRPRA